jgi:phage host-nuclease inhibitor protein Gam
MGSITSGNKNAKGRVKTELGIKSIDQVNSVMREMSETEILIKEMTLKKEQKINIINLSYDPEIDRLRTHYLFFEKLLKEFCKKQKEAVLSRFGRFEFGKVKFENKKIVFELKTDLAKKRIGQP